MEKIEKEIKKTYYVSFDGTEFETEVECMAYESTEIGVMLAELQPCVVALSITDASMMDYFGQKKHYMLFPRTRHDIFTIERILKASGSEDKCSSEDLYKPFMLSVGYTAWSGIVKDVAYTDLDKWMRKISNNKFSVVSLIKESNTEKEKRK